MRLDSSRANRTEADESARRVTNHRLRKFSLRSNAEANEACAGLHELSRAGPAFEIDLPKPIGKARHTPAAARKEGVQRDTRSSSHTRDAAQVSQVHTRVTQHTYSQFGGRFSASNSIQKVSKLGAISAWVVLVLVRRSVTHQRLGAATMLDP